jgi:tetratricopeptide (TPR) repeat protein
MIKRILKNAGLLVFSFAFLLGGAMAQAQESAGTPAAKAAFEQGEAARKKQDFAKAAEFYRKAIDLDPNYVEAHSRFLFMSKVAVTSSVKSDLPEEERSKQIKLAGDAKNRELIALYEGWAQKDPKNPSYQWALGDLYEYKDYDRVEQYTLNAVRLDPKFARAYQTLALISDVRGDHKKQLEYLKKSVDASPQDASYAFYYADALSNSNPALYRKKAIEVAERFPNHERGAQSLYWLAFDTDNTDEKIAIYERLKSSFPPEKFSWSEDGMTGLFDAYAKTDPQKALALAEEMNKSSTNERTKKSWQERASYQQNLLQARAFIAEKKYTEAAALLEKTALPRSMNADALHLAKAEALDGAGQTDKAYEGLLKLVSTEPTDALHAAFTKYGTKLNKSADQINSDVRGALEAKAKPVKEFSLARYGDEKQVSLADYRGKVVLLNFWYPFCGPCRGENPQLQKVLAKYGPDKFVILAVNIFPEQDKFVLPYIRGNKFGFIPLRGSEEFAEKEFKASGMPTNFLIDPQGRIVFKPGIIRGDEMRKLELRLEAILPMK